MLQTATEIRKRAEAEGVELLLPTDHQVVDSYEPVKGQEILAKTIPIEFTNAGHAGMDIGVETVTHFASALKDARTIIWNGRSEEHTSELQSRGHLVCRLLLEKKKL